MTSVDELLRAKKMRAMAAKDIDLRRQMVGVLAVAVDSAGEGMWAICDIDSEGRAALVVHGHRREFLVTTMGVVMSKYEGMDVMMSSWEELVAAVRLSELARVVKIVMGQIDSSIAYELGEVARKGPPPLPKRKK
jgi:hypothetical protein